VPLFYLFALATTIGTALYFLICLFYFGVCFFWNC